MLAKGAKCSQCETTLSDWERHMEFTQCVKCNCQIIKDISEVVVEDRRKADEAAKVIRSEDDLIRIDELHLLMGEIFDAVHKDMRSDGSSHGDGYCSGYIVGWEDCRKDILRLVMQHINELRIK